MILRIKSSNTEIEIGDNKISIDDRYTLIQGKFKLNQILEYNNIDYLKIQENLDLIPLENFIRVISNEPNNSFNLIDFTPVLEILSDYNRVVEKNLELYEKFKNNIEIMDSIFHLIFISARKKILHRELELSKIRKSSSELLADADLMKSLAESIKRNEVKLSYLKEDFFQRKNQIEDIQKSLSTYETLIQEQSQIKKDCFNQINKITRQMEGSKTDYSDDSFLRLGIDINLTNSEKIRALQKKAKNTLYEIRNIKQKSKQSRTEFEELSPNYEIFKNDYEEILETIKNDQKRLGQAQENYEKKLREGKEFQFGESKEFLSQPLRPMLEIEQEILKVESELDNLSIPNNLDKKNGPSNLSTLIEMFKEIDAILRDGDEKMKISVNENEIEEFFEHFHIFENFMKNIEKIMNNFLKEIHLRVQFNLVTNQMNTVFFVKTNFIRNFKIRANFTNLTTPEKIFFIISFFISVKILFNSKNIIFSNLFILPAYNKGGSIYRTIRKIIPLFETEENLSNVRITLLMSNLKLNKDIEKMKIIKLMKGD